MTKIVVDGTEVDVPGDYTLLQACEAAGAEIPRFCYHERLSVAGNCRMCLVEVKGAPKPVASCAQQVKDQRPGPNGEPPVVVTKSSKVKAAREGVMEFLLINHPLDCPICDQGGECDLQDQAVAFGRAGSRYDENKRAVEEKSMGPLVKTVMTRCIQCTRCVRFATEVAGVSELGAIGRGEDMEITTYLEQSLTSELSANVVDLCPVGALTSKPYAFNARPWELKKTETVDVMDAVGSNIRVDARGNDVLRVLPRLNEEINEEWLSDKSRHAVDGLRRQRLDKPYVKTNGKLAPVSWPQALEALAARLKGDAAKIGAIAGDLNDAEGLKAALDLLRGLGVTNTDCRQDGAAIGLSGQRGEYLFNSTIMGIEDADALLIIGSNLRLEAPLINARVRKTWLRGTLDLIGVVGEANDLTYAYEHVGAGPKTLADLAKGKGDFFKRFAKAERPMLIIGMDALTRPDGAHVLKLAAEIGMKAKIVREGWNGWNVVHQAAGRVGALDLGFLPADQGLSTAQMLEAGALDTLILLGADEVKAPAGAFVVYVGSNGDAGAQQADLILPAAAYTEKNATYVNTEGRVQQARRAVFPKGDAREDWAIFRAVSALLGKTLPYDNLDALRAKLMADSPSFAGLDFAPGGSTPLELKLLGVAGDVDAAPFTSAITDFYLTNPIARSSQIMAECSAAKKAASVAAIAAE
ncbi:MAG: NADH-quinone oxidoreductase subunit NuoG [Aquidulcibacter sp.]|uniref:NADH-quinone oxidoreductase subunit NuoG n=1 Tax=Aquidulcibacter sp. TaxID=2052990 RepID=UPI0022BD7C63|nr:NADH-quinone oxidoreductase subunit NuoG [Aquidulcibacter sp.]MCZ8209657.1 NADH-quinone oxidoreductase subunit NuoG [Aquidulcibacter sp.]